MNIKIESVLSVNQYGATLSKKVSGWCADEEDTITPFSVVDIETCSIEEASAMCASYNCREFINNQGRVIGGKKVVDTWNCATIAQVKAIGLNDEVEARIINEFASFE